MRIQHYEYDVEGETRRLLVLSETTVDLSNGFDQEWRERTGFHGVMATRESVQLGEYFEPDIDPVSKLVEEVAAGTITADDIAAISPGERFLAAEEPKVDYPTAQPTITREQAGRAFHDAEDGTCIAWDQHGKGTRDHFIAKGVKMLALLNIKVDD